MRPSMTSTLAVAAPCFAGGVHSTVGLMQWFQDFSSDLAAYKALGASPGRTLVSSRGLWALLQYRVAHHFRRYRVLRPLLLVWRLLIEMSTGISIGSAARIGPGLHISHADGIVISGRAVLGANCYITHGVTIGVSGGGARRGVPTIGDGVYIGPHAVIVGPISIGDGAMIGANCVVWWDVPAGARVRPAVPSCIIGGEKVPQPGSPALHEEGNRDFPESAQNGRRG